MRERERLGSTKQRAEVRATEEENHLGGEDWGVGTGCW